MVESVVPYFCNDAGVDTIYIGVSEFKCMGASPPYDHPHVYLDMGVDTQIICPYCSTIYIRDVALDPVSTRPEACLFQGPSAD